MRSRSNSDVESWSNAVRARRARGRQRARTRRSPRAGDRPGEGAPRGCVLGSKPIGGALGALPQVEAPGRCIDPAGPARACVVGEAVVRAGRHSASSSLFALRAGAVACQLPASCSGIADPPRSPAPSRRARRQAAKSCRAVAMRVRANARHNAEAVVDAERLAVSPAATARVAERAPGDRARDRAKRIRPTGSPRGTVLRDSRWERETATESPRSAIVARASASSARLTCRVGGLAPHAGTRDRR
jgi:hypothetical protein